MSYAGGSEGVTGTKTPRLLDQVRARLRLKHYSIRTGQAYVGWIRRSILANDKRHPRDMGVGEETRVRKLGSECTLEPRTEEVESFLLAFGQIGHARH